MLKDHKYHQQQQQQLKQQQLKQESEELVQVQWNGQGWVRVPSSNFLTVPQPSFFHPTLYDPGCTYMVTKHTLLTSCIIHTSYQTRATIFNVFSPP